MITITSMAEEKIRELMKDEQDTIGLRAYVKGGGCHGYQYGMSFESKMGDDDTVILKVEQVGGAACHTGHRSCFYKKVENGAVHIEGQPVFDPKEVYRK